MLNANIVHPEEDCFLPTIWPYIHVTCTDYRLPNEIVFLYSLTYLFGCLTLFWNFGANFVLYFFLK